MAFCDRPEFNLEYPYYLTSPFPFLNTYNRVILTFSPTIQGTRSRREERSKEILALEEVGLLVPYLLEIELGLRDAAAAYRLNLRLPVLFAKCRTQEPGYSQYPVGSP